MLISSKYLHTPLCRMVGKGVINYFSILALIALLNFPLPLASPNTVWQKGTSTYDVRWFWSFFDAFRCFISAPLVIKSNLAEPTLPPTIWRYIRTTPKGKKYLCLIYLSLLVKFPQSQTWFTSIGLILESSRLRSFSRLSSDCISRIFVADKLSQTCTKCDRSIWSWILF